MTIQQNLNIIKNIQNFKENWNGYDSKKIPKEVCDFSAYIIKNLGNYQPKVFPTGRESIQFEYEKENGEYLEFEIYSSKRIEMFRILENKEEIEKNIDLDQLEEIVKEFKQHQQQSPTNRP